jgi:hypothetical protein
MHVSCSLRPVITSAVLTAAMINAIRPFGYPLSEVEPALRLRRGAARLITKGESRRPPGNYICQQLHFIGVTYIHLLDTPDFPGQSGNPSVKGPWRKVVHPHVATTEASLWALALLRECWGAFLWDWQRLNRYWNVFHSLDYTPR